MKIGTFYWWHNHNEKLRLYAEVAEKKRIRIYFRRVPKATWVEKTANSEIFPGISG